MNQKAGETKTPKLPFWKGISGWIKFYSIGTYHKADEHHVFLYASALTFNIILCIIPFVLIIFSYLGNVLESQDIYFQINLFLDKLIPYTAYTDQIREIIFERVDEFIEFKTLVGILGTIGLFLTCSGLFSTIRTILNDIYGIKKDKSALIAKLRDLGMVLLTIVFFSFIVMLSPIFQIGKTVFADAWIFHELDLSSFEHYLINVILFGLTLCLAYVLFGLIPYEKMPHKVYFVSAFWATLFFELSKYGFGYYITNVVNYGRIYGNVTFIIIIAFWLYISSVIFIFAAIFGQLYRERQKLLATSKRKLIKLEDLYLYLPKKLPKSSDFKIKRRKKRNN
ncbi:MAG: YihY/virulence factor BrkB family protein [Bacteroidetes bacterium]|nr:YihY/virulence factor BrkB family protein [Bacteroidota bacterium]MBU2585971.1 YihY/virulence factor BrkB family protein [Bacteroidota bacterium]